MITVFKYLKVEELGENCSVASGGGRFQLSEGNLPGGRSVLGGCDPEQAGQAPARTESGNSSPCSVRSLPALRCGDPRSYTK